MAFSGEEEAAEVGTLAEVEEAIPTEVVEEAIPTEAGEEGDT